MIEYRESKNGFTVLQNGVPLLSHTPKEPLFYGGYGEEQVEMYRGNFQIEDYVLERIPLRQLERVETACPGEHCFHLEGRLNVKLTVTEDTVILRLEPRKGSSESPAEGNGHGHAGKSEEGEELPLNRLWMRVQSEAKEKVYGCGEQMSYFNLKGRHFPLWTSEPGVGRDKNTYMTWRCQVDSKSGGDYYNTNYPEPTYVSGRRYYLHADTTAYADFDFRHTDFHELMFWDVPKEIRIQEAEDFPALSEKLTAFLGRQGALPDWIYEGAILGLQGGTKRVTELVEKSLEKGIQVAGVWCQDWEGKRETSFGRRLQWEWKWDEKLYPGLPKQMEEFRKSGIRFLGYINPYLVKDTELYREGKQKGYFAADETGGEYLVDFGEFDCGVVDFTNPEAYDWFKEIIKKNLISFGLSGWMADFGEYLPTDVTLFNGKSPMLEHNHWPALWAKCNYDALKETGMLSELVYFMRAGGTGSQRYCPLLWAGDQCVDFSIHDGLISTVCGALSAGMIGNGLHHSDIGGYTSLYDNVRTKEVFLRWAELAAFTPVMRTHEGNRPDTNFQYYQDEAVMEAFGRLTRIHKALAPYLKALAAENAKRGIPVQRPLFYHFEQDERAYEIQTEYLLGRDLLVAPVYLEKKEVWEVYLPEDEWIHLWSQKTYGGGTHLVESPLGKIPVFYRAASRFRECFSEIAQNNS